MQKKVLACKLHQTVILAAALVFLGFSASAAGPAPLSVGGHPFRVEIARTPKEQEIGLMNRKEITPDGGMLFVFKEPELAAMWMKNTLIPLDMLFIDSAGEVVYIQENAVPESTDIITAGTEVKAVLELAGGTCRRLGITTGDRVDYEIFAR